MAKTLIEELNKIRKMNRMIVEGTYEDEDYLYDPEYYEKGLGDKEDKVYDDDNELETDTEVDFSDDMGQGGNYSMDEPEKDPWDDVYSNPEDKEVELPYDMDYTNNIHDKLMSGELEVWEIDQPILSGMLKDGLIIYNKFSKTPSWNKTRPFENGVFSFNKSATSGRGDVQTQRRMEKNRSFMSNPELFNKYINNIVDKSHKEGEYKYGGSSNGSSSGTSTTVGMLDKIPRGMSYGI